MLAHINLEKVLFLDIETVSAFSAYHELDDSLKELWDKKSMFISKEEETPEEAYERAGIYSEFGKVVCISVGAVKYQGQEKQLRIKSFAGTDEVKLLKAFNELLNVHYNTDQHLLCAHNGKEFDFPYIARRTLINNLKLPRLLDIAGKKPWEIGHLDTMELWKFGDYKHYTSLNLLTNIFGIPTPKDDIDGSEVGRVFWQENDVERIARYCEKDVVALTQLFLRFRGEELIKEEEITVV